MRNFGLIKEGFISLMLEGMKTNDVEKKRTYKQFVSAIKNSPILKKQAKIYSILEGISEIDDDDKKDRLINETYKMITDEDRKAMFVENMYLAKTLFDHNVDLTELDYVKKDLHESITNVMFLPRNVNNIKKLTESQHYLVTNNIKPTRKVLKETKDVVSPKAIMKVAIEKIYNTYPTLSEGDYQLVASVLLGESKQQKKIFNGLVAECTERLNNSKDVDKTLLESVKTKLESMEYKPETYLDDILKLTELKSSF